MWKKEQTYRKTNRKSMERMKEKKNIKAHI